MTSAISLMKTDPDQMVIFKSEQPNIAAIMGEVGSMQTRLMLTVVVEQFLQSMNVTNDMTSPQVVEMVKGFIADFPDWTIADFQLCFQNIRRGHYRSKVFNRIDEMTIREMMSEFASDRELVRVQYVADKMKREQLGDQKPFNRPGKYVTDEHGRIRVADVDDDGNPIPVPEDIKQMNGRVNKMVNDFTQSLTGKKIDKRIEKKEQAMKRIGVPESMDNIKVKFKEWTQWIEKQAMELSKTPTEFHTIKDDLKTKHPFEKWIKQNQ